MIGPRNRGPWHTWFAWRPVRTDWHGWVWLKKVERQYWRREGTSASGWNYQPIPKDSPTYRELYHENLKLKTELADARGELNF